MGVVPPARRAPGSGVGTRAPDAGHVHDAGRPGAPRTTAADTVAAVRALRDAGVRLLLFAGGDGTARDVYDALGGDTELTVLGIPTGVKMHSAVFSVNPRAAGEVAAVYGREEGGVPTRRAEVMDRDEAALRQGRVTARLYGWLPVPFVPARLQQRKTGGTVLSPDAVGGIAREVREAAQRLPGAGSRGPLLVLGPGTTTQALAAALGAEVGPTGVSALVPGGGTAEVVARNAGGDALLDLVRAGRPALVALSPVGGQGFLLGRGNQQLGPEVIRAAGGAARVLVVCTESKLAALGGRPLLVDSGDDALDAELTGYRPVITGRGALTMYRVTI
nr:NAD(+)/NADH kinase [Streptomyces boncukensis]